jgi:hypothetical protein
LANASFIDEDLVTHDLRQEWVERLRPILQGIDNVRNQSAFDFDPVSESTPKSNALLQIKRSTSKIVELSQSYVDKLMSSSPIFNRADRSQSEPAYSHHDSNLHSPRQYVQAPAARQDRAISPQHKTLSRSNVVNSLAFDNFAFKFSTQFLDLSLKSIIFLLNC